MRRTSHASTGPRFEPLEGRLLLSASGVEEGPYEGSDGQSADLVAPASLPSPANALTTDDIKEILERAIARARKLNVNATISITDREGNILAVVRMADAGAPPAALTVDIEARGRGGLEAVDGVVPTSIIAATKAGTAAFLSTDRGNAFTTRTAGQIIQRHFPPGIRERAGGPLFGVQLSSLPTSDVNKLPLGLAGDPGGLPLYRGGELLGGIGVEVNGRYTVDRSGAGGRATKEEKIALAGQIGLQPPKRIRANQILVDGIRLEYANARPPKPASLGTLPDYDALVSGGGLTELVTPRETPTGGTGRQSKFQDATLANPLGPDIQGEVPDGSRAPGGAGLDFYDEGTDTFAFLDGDMVDGQQVTAADVEAILGRAHGLNHRLRAAIRKDTPQRSQVSVAVVDVNGKVLGVFRSDDAPVFGYDVAVQKARGVAFMSRADAGDELRDLDMEVDVAALQSLFPPGDEQIINPSVDDPYGRHVDRAARHRIDLDGGIAFGNRTIGFLARPNLPDGITNAPPGPFTALAPDKFSPFNTGLQTILIIPELVEFLLDFAAVGDEATAMDMFIAGTLGGGGAVPLDSNSGDSPNDLNPGGGLPLNSLANGLQIFAGSVPLYKNGVLVGAVGVSGDGIEQDDYVSFAGAGGDLDRNHPRSYQQLPAGVRRADKIVLRDGVRLPYVKLPRSPFAGV